MTTIVGVLSLCWGTLGITVMSWAAYTQFTSGDYQGGTGGVIMERIVNHCPRFNEPKHVLAEFSTIQN